MCLDICSNTRVYKPQTSTLIRLSLIVTHGFAQATLNLHTRELDPTDTFHRNKRRSWEEEEDIYLTQINSNRGNSTPIVTEPGSQKTRRSTMLATHRIEKLLTYIQKIKKHTHVCTSSSSHYTNSKVQQESCAIAKMTARCALVK